jgi:hypothetical protein
MKPAVRQKRGPGMNKGLKKPRKSTFPKGEPYKPFRVTEPKGSGKASSKAVSGSYLPDFAMGSTGKQRRKSK